MWKHALRAFLASGVVVKAALWVSPEPTFVAPAVDGWSPAPTTPPRIGAIELLKRGDEEVFRTKGTCGFFDGISTSAVTCRTSGDVCATNTYYGNAGCCNPYEPAESCTLATTCYPSSFMSQRCTDSECSNNNFIAKCTASASPECYELQFVFTEGRRTTTMKEYGCTDISLTTEVPLVPRGFGSSDSTSTSSSTSSTTSPTPSSTPVQVTQSAGNPNNTPAIIGGVIGGLAVVGAIVFAIVFLILRDRRKKREAQLQQPQQHQDWATSPSPISPFPGMSESNYNSEGFLGCNVYGEEARSPATDDSTAKNWKAWSRVNRDKKVSQDRVTSCGPECMYGPAETEGRMVHEAPG